MRKLNEDTPAAYNEAHAKELLQVQQMYNQKLEALNNELAKQQSQLAIKYLNIAKTNPNAGTPPSASNEPAVKPTGTVNNAGQPTNAQGQMKTVESYRDILHVNAISEEVEEPIRFTNQFFPKDKASWIDSAPTKAEREARQRRLAQRIARPRRAPGYGSDAYWKRREAKDKLEGEIADLEQNIEYYEEKFSTPTFRGVNAEIEQFFADAGFEASDILNQGIPRKEKVKELKAIGVEDAEDLVDNYYYYYPQYDDTTAKERKVAEREAMKLRAKLEAKEKRLQKYMYESAGQKKTLNESVFSISAIDPEDFQELKNYLDAETISYIENESDGTIEFDDSNVDDEWQTILQNAIDHEGEPNVEPESADDDILSIDADMEEEPAEDDVAAIDDKIDEEKVFYVKIDNDGGSFTGKIYKLFDDGDWRAKVVKGESDTFEKLNYDPDWDEFDIIAFLRENYTDARIIDEEEFNDAIEESFNPHAIPTLEQFLGENNARIDAKEIAHINAKIKANDIIIKIYDKMPGVEEKVKELKNENIELRKKLRS